MVKPRIKISSRGFRPWDGAECFGCIQGLIKTVRKQDRDLVDCLRPNPVLL